MWSPAVQAGSRLWLGAIASLEKFPITLLPSWFPDCLSLHNQSQAKHPLCPKAHSALSLFLCPKDAETLGPQGSIC